MEILLRIKNGIPIYHRNTIYKHFWIVKPMASFLSNIFVTEENLQKMLSKPNEPTPEDSSTIVQLQELFPDLDKEKIRSALSENKGNFDATFNALTSNELDMSFEESTNFTPIDLIPGKEEKEEKEKAESKVVEIDLHGYNARNALYLVINTLNQYQELLRKNSWPIGGSECVIRIITGVGNHSKNGIAVLRPMVNAYLTRDSYTFKEEPDRKSVV